MDPSGSEEFKGAIIIINGNGNARRRIAGLSVLARLLKQLEAAGVESVVLLAKDQDMAERLVADVHKELPSLDLHIRIKQKQDVTKLPAQRMPKGRCLIMPGSAVLHKDLVHYLLNAPLDGNENMVVRASIGNDVVVAAVQTSRLRQSQNLADLFTPNGAGVLDPKEYGWFAFTAKNDESAKAAEDALIASVIKPLDVDGIVCWLITRRISTAITRRLLRLPFRVRPWHVTVFAFLFGLAGGVVASFGTYWSIVIGAFLYQVSTICDNIDGEIARLTWSGSYLGQWLDTLSDDTTNIFFIMGMSVGLSRGTDFPFHWPYYWVLGLFTVIMLSTYNFFVYRYLLRYTNSGDVFFYRWFFDVNEDNSKQDPSQKSGLDRIVYYLKFVGRRDFFIAAFLILAIFDVLFVGLVAATIASFITFVLVLLQEFKYNAHIRTAPMGDEP